MNRREFLQRMFTAGLVVATPKIIFDLGANSYKDEFNNSWYWVNQLNPHGVGYYFTEIGPKYMIGPKLELIIDPHLKGLAKKYVVNGPLESSLLQD